MKIIKIEGNSVDIVLMIVPDQFDEAKALDIAGDYGVVDAEVTEVEDLPRGFKHMEYRPFVG